MDKQIYQTLTKTNIFVNQQVQEVRENNELSEEDYKKIIDLESEIKKLQIMIANMCSQNSMFNPNCVYHPTPHNIHSLSISKPNQTNYL